MRSVWEALLFTKVYKTRPQHLLAWASNKIVHHLAQLELKCGGHLLVEVGLTQTISLGGPLVYEETEP